MGVKKMGIKTLGQVKVCMKMIDFFEGTEDTEKGLEAEEGKLVKPSNHHDLGGFWW